jgi:hypothetical protein
VESVVADWFSAQGDTRRQFQTLVDGSGAPLDLNAATVKLRASEATLGRRHRFTKDAIIVQAGSSPNYTNQGVVAYDPAAADVAAPGDLVCQWEMATVTGTRTVPDVAPFVWHIEPKLA